MSRTSFASALPSALSLFALMSAGSAEAAAFSVNFRYDGADHITSVDSNYLHGTFPGATDPSLSPPPGFLPTGIYALGGSSCTAILVGTDFSLGDCVGAIFPIIRADPSTTEVYLVAAGASQSDLNSFANDVAAAIYGSLGEVLNFVNNYQIEAASGPLPDWSANPLIISLDFGTPVSSPASMVLLGTGLLGLVGARRRKT